MKKKNQSKRTDSNELIIDLNLKFIIELLSSLIKQLKASYNRPQILNRLNSDYDRTSHGEKKNKYYELYSQYEKNIDLWSYEYLTKELQKKVLNSLVFYW